jgi:putative transposase
MRRRLQLDYPLDWHVFNRGSRRMALFRDDQDAQVFLRLLREAVDTTGCFLWAWILMTNHFHTALRGTPVQLQKCMHYVEGLYAAYHNRKYGLSGAAFEGRYEAYPQGTLAMLLRTIAYVFTNPVAAGLVAFPAEYGWSNYESYFSSAAPMIPDEADLLLERVAPDVLGAQRRLSVFVEREISRIGRGKHRPGMSAQDIQANHFDWLLEEAESRCRQIPDVQALTLAVYWAKAAGFHRSAIRTVLGGPMSAKLRTDVARLRRWAQFDPARSRLVELP